MRAALALLVVTVVCLAGAGLASSQNGVDTVSRCRLTLRGPVAVGTSTVIGQAIIRADAHVTCRYLPSLLPSWQKRIKVFITLQRFSSLYDPIPDINAGRAKSAVTEGDYMAHVAVTHVCDYTTVDYYWRARAWTVNYSARGKIGRSKVVASKYGIGKCF